MTLRRKPTPTGRSANAPGRRFKALGLPNASSIAPGRTRVRTPPTRIPPRVVGPTRTVGSLTRELRGR